MQTKVAKMPGTESSFASVSCNVGGTCEAVGNTNTQSGTQGLFAEAWNGTGWALQKTVAPKNSPYSTFSSVSCVSASDCVAVGQAISTGGLGESALGQIWNGRSWMSMSMPDPAGSQVIELQGVSCASLTACAAVGQYLSSSLANLTLAMTWDGKTWTIEPSPLTAPAGGDLFAVACTSASTCDAVGASMGSKSPAVLLVETWNGTSWSTQMAFGKPGQVPAALDKVSCIGTSFCLAVGADELQSPIAEVSNGSSWKLTSTPAGGGGGGLQDVDCVSTTDCIAVGSPNQPELGLAEQWNGSTWTALGTPGGFGALDGISCISANACMAVGSAEGTGGSAASVPLAESWNGAIWSVTATPSPSGSVQAELLSSSCTSGTSCMAVGVSQGSTGLDTPLIESWNGTKWTIATSAGTSLGSLGLTGVSCVSTTDCLAAGYSIDRLGSPGAFSEIWDGSNWTAEKTPTPTGGADLYGVECSSPTSCVTVGARGRGALAEVWDGSAWTVQKTATPAGSSGSAVFDGADCSSSTTCTAVGGYTNSRGLGLTLAEES